MTCPNGHKGGVLCCTDNVNLVMSNFIEKYKDWVPNNLALVTLDQWRLYLMNSVQRDVTEELNRAMEKWPPIRSPHEGYAIILEELDELWEAIKINQKNPTQDHCSSMYNEAKQVAAMAMRFMMDC